MVEPGPDDVVALSAAVRNAAGDLTVYASVLLDDLKDALPPQNVIVERASSLRQRLTGKPGAVLAVSLRLDQRQFTLRRPAAGGLPAASIDHVVNGIVLDTAAVDIDRWSAELAAALRLYAAKSERARTALQQLLQP